MAYPFWLLAPAGAGHRPRPEETSPEVVGRAVDLGEAYFMADRRHDVESVLEWARNQAIALHAAGRQQAATVKLQRMGVVYQRMRMYEDAVAVYSRLYAWDQERSEEGASPAGIRLAMQFGSLCIDLGRLTEAKRVLTRAVRQSEAQYGEGHLEVSTPLLLLSLAQEKSGEFEAAEQTGEKALRICESKLRRGSFRRAQAMTAMGRVLTLQKKPDLARFFLEEATEVLESHAEENPAPLINAMLDLAALHQASGQDAEAVKLLREALRRWRAIVPQAKSAHVDALLARCIKLLSDALADQGPEAKKECAALRTELKALLKKLESGRALDAETKRWIEEQG